MGVGNKFYNIRIINIIVAISCILGMLLSIYAYHVETSAHANASYSAFCDLGPKISCSKVFLSRYGSGFGIVDRFVNKDHFLNLPNSVFGMMYYTIVLILLGVENSGSPRSWTFFFQHETFVIFCVHLIGLTNGSFKIFRTSYTTSLTQLLLAILSCIGCVYLAIILIVVLDDFCVVCATTYVINAAILVGSVIKFKITKELLAGRKRE